uniref:Lysosomal membrane ascorbate-dependent ferrireductase CYB561A3 n=1 Tax=Scleropages formosus TaxID=113540 RepID=A0A8C9VIG9_SCLFO
DPKVAGFNLLYCCGTPDYLLCLCLGIVCVVFVCYWNNTWRGGFAWDGTALQFNWHPVLMVTGLVVLYGNVVYRIPLTWGQNKQPWKLLHAGLLFLAFFLSVLGLCAVFDYHKKGGIPNLYSLHSWLGMCTTVLFTAQWVLGSGAFLVPWSPMAFRKILKPVHVWMGSVIFVLGIASCISGINEKLFFPYSKLPPEAVFANSLGILIVVFGLVVLKILSNPEWQRPEPGPDDESSRVSITARRYMEYAVFFLNVFFFLFFLYIYIYQRHVFYYVLHLFSACQFKRQVLLVGIVLLLCGLFGSVAL